MEALYLEQSKSTPLIDFNAESRVLKITGESYPENSFKFFEPILEWIDNLFESISPDDEVIMELTLPYINTSSSKCIMIILDKIEEAVNKDKKIIVNWYCNKDNESEIECAEEFKDFVDIEFNIIYK